MAASPLIARSTDGSLLGIHHPPSSTADKSSSSLVRCYDGNVSNGALKFTLRIPSKTASNSGAFVGEKEDARDDPLRKLLFSGASGSASGSAAPKYLCGVKSSSILIWDLDRGVVSQTIDIHSQTLSNSQSAKKKRRSSSAGESNGVLVDAAAHSGSLYALLYFPSADGSGKCRVYEYDLNANEETLLKKIKVGSVSASSSSDDFDAGGSNSGFAIAISKSQMAIRIKNVLRICDLNSGEKLAKIDIPSKASGSTKGGSNDDSSSSAIRTLLHFSSNGKFLATTCSNHGQVVLFSNSQMQNEKHALNTLALLSPNDSSAFISQLDVVSSDNKEVTVVAFQSFSGIASLFTVNASSSTKNSNVESLAPQMPKAKLQSNTTATLIMAGFHPRRSESDLLLLFRSASSTLPMETLPYSSLEGTVTVGASTSAAANDASSNKRKAAVAGATSANVALAPGDQGMDATLATDLTSFGAKKRAKIQKEEGDDDDDGNDDEEDGEEEGGEFDDLDEDDEDGERGQSIAERLALLSSAMEQHYDDDDDEDDDSESKPTTTQSSANNKINLKSATSETLTTLLTQALSSNDMVQLNIVLQVTDRRMVENTVRALQVLDAERLQDGVAGNSETGYIPMLMGHIVRRMARRHSLVMPLGVWVRAILAATARSTTSRVLHSGAGGDIEEQMAKEGREMALKLGPLRNFLNERVECFPQLLRLEGRLALLSQQL